MKQSPYLTSLHLKGQAQTHWSAMFKLFRKSGKSDKEQEAGGPKAGAVQPIPTPRKTVLTVTKKPEKSSPVLVNRSSAPGPGKEVTSRKEEKVGDKDFLLTEMQALLDPLQCGKVKGEELRHILASIGNRWNETVVSKNTELFLGFLKRTWLW